MKRTRTFIKGESLVVGVEVINTTDKQDGIVVWPTQSYCPFSQYVRQACLTRFYGHVTMKLTRIYGQKRAGTYNEYIYSIKQARW